MLTGTSLHAFLTTQKVHVFDPDTHAPVATVQYGTDGQITMRHADGRTDHGHWGLDGDTYWTRYAHFRDGTLNRFYLEPVDAATAQAYFGDGRRAFLQSHNPSLPDPA